MLMVKMLVKNLGQEYMLLFTDGLRFLYDAYSDGLPEEVAVDCICNLWCSGFIFTLLCSCDSRNSAFYYVPCGLYPRKRKNLALRSRLHCFVSSSVRTVDFRYDSPDGLCEGKLVDGYTGITR